MENEIAEISVKGRVCKVPAVAIEGHTVIINRGWYNMGIIHDEDWHAENVRDPEVLVASLRKHSPPVDIFTFAQKLPDTTPRFPYSFGWDNVAAIPIASYKEWWNSLPQATRRNVRLAEKKNVIVKVVPFDDSLIQGIQGIYNEAPVRQGKRFWHYGKDLETVRKENSSYAERSDFIGAFLNGALIGFLKLVHVGKVGSIMQILSLSKHADKRPTNALIAKAVEVCAARDLTHLVYCQYVYGAGAESPLTEFKRRSGFEQILLPRYYLPLTAKGRLVIKLNLHLGVRRLLPKWLERAVVGLRARIYERATRKRAANETEASPA